jgi:hypothetical protein
MMRRCSTSRRPPEGKLAALALTDEVYAAASDIKRIYQPFRRIPT